MGCYWPVNCHKEVRTELPRTSLKLGSRLPGTRTEFLDFPVNQHRRKIKGQQDRGQLDREPLKGKSSSERVSERVFDRVSERVSEREGFQRLSEVFSGF